MPVRVEAGGSTSNSKIGGSAEAVARQLADLVRHGFSVLNLWPGGIAAEQREVLAKEVLPAVRALLA